MVVGQYLTLLYCSAYRMSFLPTTHSLHVVSEVRLTIDIDALNKSARHMGETYSTRLTLHYYCKVVEVPIVWLATTFGWFSKDLQDKYLRNEVLSYTKCVRSLGSG
jgi:hypothetical protein